MIKKFNNFIREDKNHLNDEMILDMEYILLSFSDLGYNPSLVLEKDPGSGGTHLYVRLVTYTDKPLVWNTNLEEDINRLNLFARQNRFEECNVLVVLNASRFKMDYKSFLRYINISNKPITNLLLYFKKI